MTNIQKRKQISPVTKLQSKEQFLNKEKSSRKWELLRNPGLGIATSKIPILKWKMKMVSFQ